MAGGVVSRDTYLAAWRNRQVIDIGKNASRSTGANVPTTVFDAAGPAGTGVLAGSSTAAGVVPTDATPGCPAIRDFAPGADGQLLQVVAQSSVACRLHLYDLLWKGGAYAFNANVTLAGQPSYSSRIPAYAPTGDPDWSQTEIWLESVTNFTGNPTVQITYQDQDDNPGDTGAISVTSFAAQRMSKINLASGDSGVRRINSVVSTVASAGTFNVLVLRPLWSGRINAVSDYLDHVGDRARLPVVFADSALFLVVQPDSSATGFPDVKVTIGNYSGAGGAVLFVPVDTLGPLALLDETPWARVTDSDRWEPSSSSAVTATAAGLASTSGSAAAAVGISASASGSATVTGQAVAAALVTGAATGATTVTGVASSAVALAGAASGLATTLGTGTGAVALVATAAGLATTTGTAAQTVQTEHGPAVADLHDVLTSARLAPAGSSVAEIYSAPTAGTLV
jgi:hypothetical protein